MLRIFLILIFLSQYVWLSVSSDITSTSHEMNGPVNAQAQFVGNCIVTTKNDAGVGSLREAINCANNNIGPDTIVFEIPDEGPHVILLESPLPIISDDHLLISTDDHGSIWVDGSFIETASAGFEIGPGVEHIVIGYLDVRNFQGPAFRIGAGSKHINIMSNRIVYNDMGVEASRVDSCEIKYNAIFYNQTSIVLNGGTYNSIFDNNISGLEVEGPTDIGIQIIENGPTHNNQIIENNVSRHDEEGVRLIGEVTETEILQNRIECNGGKGIDLGPAGNNQQVKPVIISATIEEINVSTGQVGDLIEVFSNASACDTCQGKTTLGFCLDNGDGTYTLNTIGYYSGDLLSATSTTDKNTSEFSDCFAVVSADCNRMQDSLELVSLYNNTNGAQWTNTWDLNQPMDTWYGIKVSPKGCVEAIDLDGNVNYLVDSGSSGNRLSGFMPDLQLPNLLLLSLCANEIVGGVPNFTGIPKVRHICFGRNPLTEPLPEFQYVPDLLTFSCFSTDIDGPIPSFQNCPLIQEISVYNNEHTGSIPAVNSLSELVYYGCSSNELTGPLPDISNMEHLFRFQAHFNNLSGTIPNISNCPELETYTVDRNQLTGVVPNFSNLPKLRIFGAGYNQLKGPLPDFSGFPVIESLELSNNEIDGQIPDFSFMPVLGSISLFNNELEGEIPNFSNLPNVWGINVYNNQLSGEIPDFDKMPTLTSINVNNNALEGAIPDFGQLPNLAFIIAYDNLLDGEIPDLSENCPNLKSLRVNNNRLTFEDLLPGLPNNVATVAINSETVWDSVFYEDQPMVFKDTTITLPQLSLLDVDLGFDELIQDNVYTWYKNGVLYDTVIGNNNLTIPYLKLSDAGDYHVVVTNPQADRLTLTSYTITLIVEEVPCITRDSTILMAVYQATNGDDWFNNQAWGDSDILNNWFGVETNADGCVTCLNLSGPSDPCLESNGSGNNLVGSIPNIIGELSHLEHLNLSGNALIGEIPDEIGQLGQLNSLSVSANQLSGEIPTNWQSTNNLSWLDLSDNLLVGTIPAWIGDLTNIQTLALNDNQLVGSIPSFLANQNYLELDCSNNQLSGCFPNELINNCNDPLINFTNNPMLPWNGDFQRFCDGEQVVGAACDDGNPNSLNDVILPDCSCAGTVGLAFVTTWKTDNLGTSCNTCIQVPSFPGELYNYDIDWENDGVYDDFNLTGDAIHDYGIAGNYQVAIRGNFPRIYFNGLGDAAKIQSIDQWGSQEWTSMESAFAGCINLTGLAEDIPNLSKVSTTERMFAGATNFNQDLNDWDLSQVENMRFMFADASTFNGNISSWNTSMVTDFTSMFTRANSFNQDIGNWDVSSGTTMANLFFGATDFNQDIGSWDVSQITDFSFMFSSARSFNQDIGNWDVSNGVLFNNMFEDATVFNQALNGWQLSNAENLEVMFAVATEFNQDISNWNVSNVTDMSNMFLLATAFNQDLNNWDVGKVTNMAYMFEGASSFNQHLASWDLANIINNPNLADGLAFMLSNCGMDQINYETTLNAWANANSTPADLELGADALTYCDDSGRNILIGDKNWLINGDQKACAQKPWISRWKTDNNGNSCNACIAIPTNNAYTYNYDIDWENDGIYDEFGLTTDAFHMYPSAGSYEVAIRGDFPHLNHENIEDNDKLIDIIQWGEIEWLSIDFMFHACRNIVDFSATDTPMLSGVNQAISTFEAATQFDGRINDWSIQSMTNLSRMFAGASSFNQIIDSWNTANVEDMSGMFSNATMFNRDISAWNTGKLTNMEAMFVNCINFSTTINDWDVSNVVNFARLFEGASNFNRSLNDWDVSKAQTMDHMFDGASNFDGAITNWDISNVSTAQYMFSDAINFKQDISVWSTTNLQNSTGMFANAISFNHALGTWNLTNLIEAEHMLDACGMSTPNYEATLLGWSSNVNTSNDLGLGALDLVYCDDTGRNALINTFGWQIVGDSQDPSCGCPSVNAGESMVGMYCTEQEMISLLALLSNADVNGNWEDPLNTGIDLSDPTQVDVGALDAGEYYFYYILGEIGCPMDTNVVNINISSSYSSQRQETLCFGESIEIGNEVFDATGMYEIKLQALNQCDSIILLDLEVLDPISETLDVEACFGEELEIGGQIIVVNQTSPFSETILLNSLSHPQCDSLLSITIYPIETTSFEYEDDICTGEVVEIGGIIFDASNLTGEVTLDNMNAQGCDSIIYVNLNIKEATEGFIMLEGCPGDLIELNGESIVIADEGPYTLTQNLQSDEFPSCDSLLTINVSVKEDVVIMYEDFICGDEEKMIGDQLFNKDFLSSQLVFEGVDYCDSIVNVQFTHIDSIDGLMMDTVTQSSLIAIDVLEGFAYDYSQGINLEVIDYDQDKIISVDEQSIPGIFEIEFNQNVESDVEIQFEMCYEDCSMCATSIWRISKSIDGYVEFVITCNDDGINDNVLISEYVPNLFIDFPCNEIVIFNRWGQPVYEAQPYLDDWCGTYMNTGNPLPEGSYYFTLDLYSPNANCAESQAGIDRRFIYGLITLLR